MAIRIAGRHLLAGDGAACAGNVAHHHRLAERLGERRLDGARDQIRPAAGWKADEHLHRPVGEGRLLGALCGCAADSGCEHEGARRRDKGRPPARRVLP
jgi:hypothetical protein